MYSGLIAGCADWTFVLTQPISLICQSPDTCKFIVYKTTVVRIYMYTLDIDIIMLGTETCHRGTEFDENIAHNVDCLVVLEV